MTNGTRYDEFADWYDRYIREDKAGITRLAGDTLAELLGPGPGRCLDLCCGGGIHMPVLLGAGWAVVGVDESAEQLRIARDRLGDRVELVKADANALPFPDCSFDAIAAAFVHSDVGEFELVLAEAARVLRPGKRLVHIGTHPCFVAPSIELVEGGRVVHPGYRREGWSRDGPGIGAGIRSRVGVHHVTLARFLNSFATAGLRLERAVEPGNEDPPTLFAVAARKYA